jgi:hypothetical protein
MASRFVWRRRGYATRATRPEDLTRLTVKDLGPLQERTIALRTGALRIVRLREQVKLDDWCRVTDDSD